jgi:hypothetical protein
MSARRDPVIAELREHLDVDADEANLYLHLVAAGPSRASDVAETLHMHRSEVYRAMERLEERGLVRSSGERPTLYAAVEIGALLDAQMGARVAEVESLRASRREIEEILLATRHDAEPARPTYKLLHGRPEIARARAQMLAGAQRSLDWATTFAPAIRLWLDSGEIDALKPRVEKGLRFRALLPPCPEAKEVARVFQGMPGAQLRTLATRAPIRFSIFEARDLLVFILNDASPSAESSEEAAIQTSAPGFVLTQQTFFDQMWSAAAPDPLLRPSLELRPPPPDMGLLEPRERRVQPIRGRGR